MSAMDLRSKVGNTGSNHTAQVKYLVPEGFMGDHDLELGLQNQQNAAPPG